MKNAGMEINIFFQSILIIFSNIDRPTNINIGAIADIGTQATKGARNIDKKKQIEANIAVNPVLPPTSIPTLLSTYEVTLLVPNRAPKTVDIESHIIAFSNFFDILPFSSNLKILAFLPVPINVPIVSNFQIIKPPIEVQKNYYAFVEQVDKSKFEIQRYLKNYKECAKF